MWSLAKPERIESVMQIKELALDRGMEYGCVSGFWGAEGVTVWWFLFRIKERLS